MNFDLIKRAVDYINYWTHPTRGELRSSLIISMEKAIRLLGLNDAEKIQVKVRFREMV